MAKIIKNKTGSTKIYYGISIPDQIEYEIHPLELGGFQKDDLLIADITAGQTAMIDSSEPGVEYTGFSGVDFLQKDELQMGLSYPKHFCNSMGCSYFGF